MCWDVFIYGINHPYLKKLSSIGCNFQLSAHTQICYDNKMVIYYENTTQSVWHTVILSLLDRRTDDFRYDECNFCLNVTRMRSYRRMHLHMYLRAHNAIITAMSQPSEDKDDFQRHIAPHRLSGTQEEPVAIEAERESCFPFCDEHPSAGHSGESAPLFVLRYIHHHWQKTPKDLYQFPLVFCIFQL